MLNEITIGEHQEELHNMLRKLALSDNTLWSEGSDLGSYSECLSNIYKEDFHHQYSKLFDVVNSIFEDDDKDVSVFQENLKILREFLLTNDDGLLKIFDKLRDHLSLEISRRESFKNHEYKIADLRNHYTDMENKAESIQNKMNELSDRLSKIQTDFVSILAIFASVVVAFSSGSNYMLSALSAASKTFTREVVFITLLCGLILMDTLFMLIYFIGSIIERHIGYKWWLAVLANLIVIVAIVWVCNC